MFFSIVLSVNLSVVMAIFSLSSSLWSLKTYKIFLSETYCGLILLFLTQMFLSANECVMTSTHGQDNKVKVTGMEFSCPCNIFQMLNVHSFKLYAKCSLLFFFS